VSSKTANPLGSGIVALIPTREALSLHFEPRGDSKKAVHEFVREHAVSLAVDNLDVALLRITECLTVDDDVLSVRVIGVFDQLDESGRVSPDKQLAELPEDVSVDGEGMLPRVDEEAPLTTRGALSFQISSLSPGETLHKRRFGAPTIETEILTHLPQPRELDTDEDAGERGIL
jgi:hypothetical protein